MADIQVGDRVKIINNPWVGGHQYEPTDESKNLNPLKVEDLGDQLGTVIETRLTSMKNYEVIVKLDKGIKVIIKNRFLTKVD